MSNKVLKFNGVQWLAAWGAVCFPLIGTLLPLKLDILFSAYGVSCMVGIIGITFLITAQRNVMRRENKK
jgi:hypothetical protein